MQASWLTRIAQLCCVMLPFSYYVAQRAPYSLTLSGSDEPCKDGSSTMAGSRPNFPGSRSIRNESRIPEPCGPEIRTSFLKHMCKDGEYDTFYSEYAYRDMYVSEEHKYMACLPQKSGCTSWKTILVNNTIRSPLEEDFDGTLLHGYGLELYGIKRLSTYNHSMRQDILKEYYKFMVVRHPLDRLVSAYNDKIHMENNLFFRKGVLALEKQRHNTSLGEYAVFLEYVVRNGNPHWTPVSLLCDVCNVQYDRIVKLETQSHDVREIIPHLGPYNRSLDAHANKKGTGAAKELTWSLPAFANVSKSLLDEVLALGFDYDLKLFGYSWRNVSSDEGLSASCGYPDEQCC